MYTQPTTSDQYPGVQAPSASSPVTGAPATGEELAAQMLCDLGYLAVLINAYNSSSTSAYKPQYAAGIEQLVNEINSNMSAVQAADPVAYAILNFAMAPSGGGLSNIESNGQLNTAELTQFMNIWNSGNGNTDECLPAMIAQWMAGQAPGQNGTVPFNFQTANDPNTMYGYLMFMSSLTLCSDTQFAAGQDLQSFLAYDPNGALSTAQEAGMFMTSYMLGTQDPIVPMYAAASALAALTPNAPADYTSFVDVFYCQVIPAGQPGAGEINPYYCGWNGMPGQQVWAPPPGQTILQAELNFATQLRNDFPGNN